MLHSQLIEETGGSDGVRDYNLLESAIESPFQSFGGDELYPTMQKHSNRNRQMCFCYYGVEYEAGWLI